MVSSLHPGVLSVRLGFLGFATDGVEPVQRLRYYEIFMPFALPETSITPETRPSQRETSIPTIHFQVLC